jgi:putative tryptophan/tyrosine transport system substrate-binding protein
MIEHIRNIWQVCKADRGCVRWFTEAVPCALGIVPSETGDRMRKLAFALLVTMLMPCAAAPQQPAKVYRVATLSPVCEVAPLDAAKGTSWEGVPLHSTDLILLRAVRDSGIGEHSLHFERHCYQPDARPEDVAAELATRKPDVAIAWGSVATRALKTALRAPIVFIGVDDPVSEGFVESLARPGRNLTGVNLQLSELATKRAQFHRELLPQGKRLAVMYLRADEAMLFPLPIKPPFPSERFGFEVQLVPVDGWEGIEAALLAMRQQPPDLLHVPGTGRMHVHAERLLRLAAAGKIPTTCTLGPWSELGCLMIYAVNYDDQVRRAGRILGKLLLGANPAETPVEQGVEFELSINLRTADAVGITIPPSLLARANRVIE